MERCACAARMLLLLLLASAAHAIKITVAPGRTDCFSETVLPSHFQVPGGPRVDGRVLVSGNSQYYVPFVSITVTGPQGHELWKSEQVYSEAHFNIAAHGPGMYQVCVHNPPDSRTEAIIDLVYFTLAHLRQGNKASGPIVVPRGTEDQRSQEVANAEHMDEVSKIVMSMTEFLNVVMGSQRYLQRKLDRHMQTMISSNHRTMGYALLEVAILLGIVAAQVLIITKFFTKTAAHAMSRLSV